MNVSSSIHQPVRSTLENQPLSGRKNCLHPGIPLVFASTTRIPQALWFGIHLSWWQSSQLQAVFVVRKPGTRLSYGGWTTMSTKSTKIPDSDVADRGRVDVGNTNPEEAGNTEGRQTSLKTGKHSSVEKKAASRPELRTAPGAHPKDGAFGDPTPDKHRDRPAGTPGSEGLNGRPGGVSNKASKARGKKV